MTTSPFCKDLSLIFGFLFKLEDIKFRKDFNWLSGVDLGDGDSDEFGLPEGQLVWIKDAKIWKEPTTGHETPMIISKRAAVIGNSRVESAGKPFELVSFIGQVPVIIIGSVNNGDLLIPNVETHCLRAVSKEECSFNQYKMAVGTAWGEVVTTDDRLISKVMCAVGIK